MRTVPLEIAVGPELPDGGEAVAAIDLHLPDALAGDAKLFFAIPGGGMNRRYFDLDGGPGTAFSFARAATDAGHVVAAVDPIGVGGSSRPADAYMLTGAVEADLLHRAFIALRARSIEGIALGALPAIGCGHSAGAMLAALQQAATCDFAALALLCFGTGGLPQHFRPEHLAALAEAGGAALPAVARAMFGGDGYAETAGRSDDSPAARALGAAAAPVIAPVAVLAMSPGNIAVEIAAIDVPVFLALGARDMTGPPHAQVGGYRACPDMTLHVVDTARHNLFATRHSTALFDRVMRWTSALPA